MSKTTSNACVAGGQPPCPICPQQKRCHWAERVLRSKDPTTVTTELCRIRTAERKSA